MADESLFTEEERELLNYFKRTIGDYYLPKEQLILCDRVTQACNCDSILFLAGRFGIRVLAQRETDLLWIAQEAIVHPKPP